MGDLQQYLDRAIADLCHNGPYFYANNAAQMNIDPEIKPNIIHNKIQNTDNNSTRLQQYETTYDNNRHSVSQLLISGQRDNHWQMTLQLRQFM